MSTKGDNFVRLAKARQDTICKQFKILGNLANISNYDYNEAQVNALFATLESALRAEKRKFKDGLEKKAAKEAKEA